MNGSLAEAGPKVSLVIGGARSGKSSLAGRLAMRLSGSGRLHLVATATAGDEEMADRIARHRADRAASGVGWILHEVPHDLPAVLGTFGPGDVVVVDCLTLWLANVTAGGAETPGDAAETACKGLIGALEATTATVVLVSNEVGWGIVPANPLGRSFRDAQGRVNARVAARADLVVGVMAGLPFVLKGRLPDGL
ncbi:MAG: bifunctional adenosylcobinamide kinase/adenosylcobinamide-phosphate guanylyltransferase [Rhodobacteraceae bacterium]|nr:bifunctional adenosylcobinamide kinase/adenosylcobinamide-phosphate guanylyltransferase [Paracoccaceae bacterium]